MKIESVAAHATVEFQIDDRFVPPQMKEWLDRWPEYRAAGGHWSLAAFLAEILKQIDTAQPNGYDGQKAFDEFVNWLGGLTAFGAYLSRLGSAPPPAPSAKPQE